MQKIIYDGDYPSSDEHYLNLYPNSTRVKTSITPLPPFRRIQVTNFQMPIDSMAPTRRFKRGKGGGHFGIKGGTDHPDNFILRKLVSSTKTPRNYTQRGGIDRPRSYFPMGVYTLRSFGTSYRTFLVIRGGFRPTTGKFTPQQKHRKA